ncbi:hypothetical protein ColTof4_14402 [Colletotrichum tofieldiae]|nr:hypothetical protein ColTof3_14878 [Colletotrichum tofieldiae]GKT81979.1 hypothetical protein ColTof4_14402 [Colletotrichum tofieldiae]
MSRSLEASLSGLGDDGYLPGGDNSSASISINSSKQASLERHTALVRELVALGAPKPRPGADPGLAAMWDIVWPTFERLAGRADELEAAAEEEKEE